MRIGNSNSAVLLIAAVIVGVATSGCGSRPGKGTGADMDAVTQRARQVAEAWDGSPAADKWRAGYHPMSDVIQPPRGGLQSNADEQAYRDHSFVLRGKLPAAWPRTGKIAWDGGGDLTLPLTGPQDSYTSLSYNHQGSKPHLTVTNAKLGTMTLVTSRGPATVPAWLYSLDGYASPLKQAAVKPSKLPASPIGPADDTPVRKLSGLSEIAADGRSVTVVALHGVCEEGPEIDVLETASSVVLSLVEQPESGRNCTKQARIQQVRVEVDRPVSDRILLDAKTGRPLPYTPENGASPSWS
ncbi:hypothetical protein ACFVU3_29040 [Streptomyces sp. NPDC058052]|uniref:hypothetical protein n=1 Tax=Streptomyces sp. NPDC058052 TaxID=3346316 RepID=UPI0036E9FB9E